MPFLPEWAPNVHPLVLHFPIALLFLAGIFDLVGLASRDSGPSRKTSDWLYLLGAVSAVATWFTGRAAADSVFLPTEANALLTEHADLGLWTMWFFVGYATIRTGLSFTAVASKLVARAGMFVLGGAGLVLLTITATHGAELVYKHGVGVEAVETRPSTPAVSLDIGDSGFAATDDGWFWTTARPSAWKGEASWIEGSPESVRASLVDGGERGDVLELSASEPALFVFPGVVGRLQVDVTLDVSDFDGSVLVAHHVQGDGSYGFTSLGNDTIRLGKTENSDLLVQATESFDGSDWRDVRVVADGTHFRSYADQQVLIHGHGAAFEPGRVGLRLNGTGTVRVASMHVVDLSGSVEEAPLAEGNAPAQSADTAAADTTAHDH